MLVQIWGYCFTAVGAILFNDLYGPGLIGKIAGIALGVSLTIIGIVYGFNNSRLNKVLQLLIHGAVWAFSHFIGSTLELIVLIALIVLLSALLGKGSGKPGRKTIPQHIYYQGSLYVHVSGNIYGTMVYETPNGARQIVIHRVWNISEHSADTDIGLITFAYNPN